MNIRDRIKELRFVSSGDIAPNPKNWRLHPEDQKKAMSGILDEIGFAAAAIARELPDGKIMLIDGHMRHELASGETMPVLVLDVTEEEADRLLLALDPIKELADADAVALQSLFDSVETHDEAVAKLFEKTADAAGLLDSDHDHEPHAEEEAVPSNEETLAGVRMVQLFLNETNISDFHQACLSLEGRFGTDNITDTVLEALRSAVSSL